MSGKIGKYDVFSKEALDTIGTAISQFDVLVTKFEELRKTNPGTTLEDVAKHTQDSTNQIQKLTAQYASLESALSKLSTAVNKKTTEDKKNSTEIQDNIRLQKLYAKQNAEAGGSLTQLSVSYSILKEKMRQIRGETVADLDAMKKLSIEMVKLRGRMENLSSTGTKGGKSFNMLNWQVQQFARELPSMAYGFNVFVGAISNNLPMLMDEIKNAQLAQAALKKEGKSTVPVWKQVVGSIMSWQTALVVGVTLLTLYGREIADFVTGLIKGAKAINGVELAMNQMHEATMKAFESSSQESANLKLLYEASQNTALSMEDRTAAVNEMQKLYPDYLGNMKDEEILAGGASEQYDFLSKAIIKKAIAQAFAQKIAENNVKIFELEQEGFKKAAKWMGVAQSALGVGIGTGVGNAFLGNVADKIQGLKDANNEIAKQVDMTDLLFTGGKEEKGKKKKKDKLEPEDNGNWLINMLAMARDVYNADYEKRTSMARNNALELIDIEIEKAKRILEIDLMLKELTLTEREEYNSKIRELEQKRSQWIDDDRKATYDKEIEDRQEVSTEMMNLTYDLINKEALAKSKAATDEYNSYAGLVQKRRFVEIKLANDLLQLEKDRLQEAIDSGELTIKDKEEAAARILGIEENLEKGKRDLSEETRNIILGNIKATQDIASKGFEIQAQFSENASARNENRYKREMQLAGESEDKKLVAQRKYEKEKRKIDKRAATAKKMQTVFGIILDTASAVVEALPNVPLSILAGVLGGAALTAALTAPMPQFATGTDNAPKTFIAGEQGMEAILTPSGDTILTPNKATIFNDKALVGSTIVPHDETMKMISQNALGSVSNMIDMSDTNSLLRDMNNKEDVSYTSDGYKIVRRKNFVGKYKV